MGVSARTLVPPAASPAVGPCSPEPTSSAPRSGPRPRDRCERASSSPRSRPVLQDSNNDLSSRTARLCPPTAS